MTLESEPEDGGTNLLTLGEKAEGMAAEKDPQRPAEKKYVLCIRPRLSLTSNRQQLLHRRTKRKRQRGLQN